MWLIPASSVALTSAPNAVVPVQDDGRRLLVGAGADAHRAPTSPICRKGGVVALRVQDLVHLHHTIVSLARCAQRQGETPYWMSNMSKLNAL